ALGLVALGKGDANDAIAHLEECSRTRMAEQMPEQAVIPWAYDLVEAYARAGRAEEAEKLLAGTRPRPRPAPGERPPRERPRAQAREPLREALQVFDRLGAVDWAARARA